MLQNGTIMPPKKHYYAGKMHYYAGIMLDAPHIVLCSKLCRHNVSTPSRQKTTEARSNLTLLHNKDILKILRDFTFSFKAFAFGN